mgnify:CR=1 FL=1
MAEKPGNGGGVWMTDFDILFLGICFVFLVFPTMLLAWWIILDVRGKKK